MKRIVIRCIVFVCVFAILVVLSGCSQGNDITEEPIAEEPIAVISSEVVRAMVYVYPINEASR